MQYKFIKGQPKKLYFKYHYGSPEFEFATFFNKIVTRNTKVTARPMLYTTPPGIDPSKKASLLKMCSMDKLLIPAEYHNFFENLIENNEESSDDDDETSDNDEQE